MSGQEIASLVSSIGLPGVILFYLIWRFDKFLTFLCGKLEKYNDELSTIGFALKDIVEELKGLRKQG